MNERDEVKKEESFNLVNKLAKLVLVFFLTGAAAFALWTWATLQYVYSRGERAGYVQKISKKGWIFKTWEGELTMVSLPGTAPEQFKFTVRNAAVVPDIQKTLGHRVVLAYEEHRGIPLSIFGETQYFVTGAASTQDAGASSGLTPFPVK